MPNVEGSNSKFGFFILTKMKSNLILSFAILILLLSQSLFSQQDYGLPKELAYDNANGNELDLFGQEEKDFKIISSNASYIEIEFYPQYTLPQTVNCGNQCYSVISFKNYNVKGPEFTGYPDLRYRIFPNNIDCRS